MFAPLSMYNFRKIKYICLIENVQVRVLTIPLVFAIN